MKLYIVCGFDFFDYRRIFGVCDSIYNAGVKKKELEQGGEYSLSIEILEVELNTRVDV